MENLLNTITINAMSNSLGRMDLPRRFFISCNNSVKKLLISLIRKKLGKNAYSLIEDQIKIELACINGLIFIFTDNQDLKDDEYELYSCIHKYFGTFKI